MNATKKEMHGSFKKLLSTVLCWADLLSAEIVIGVKMSSWQSSTWITNGTMMRDKLMTDGLRFCEGDDFYEETETKDRKVVASVGKDNLYKQKEFNGNNFENVITTPEAAQSQMPSEPSYICQSDRFNEPLPTGLYFNEWKELSGETEKKDYEETEIDMEYRFISEKDIKIVVSGDEDHSYEELDFTRNNSEQELEKNIGEKPFKCSICLQSFSQSSNLTSHLRTHTGDKPFNCTRCPKSFSQSSNLKRHLQSHTGEKPFKCLQCQKSFSQPIHLKRHLQTHTGEKPFKCLQCQQLFARPDDLKEHSRKHTGEKPYKCSMCLQSFAQSSNLKAHHRTHTGDKPFDCSQCPKSFSQSSNLKSHLRTHTGDKPYKCLQCQKCFNQPAHLKRHLQTHTGEKPFKCFKCQKSFTQPGNLKKHIGTHKKYKAINTYRR